jgi:flap endonuclease-1
MDALTFGTPRLLRRMMAPEAKKLPILEFHHDAMLHELGMGRDEFIDLCILCGCDYTQTIRGVGPKKAYEGIAKYRNIEAFVASLDPAK